jgi:multidrug transporter EmrE-like cation transporter
LALVVKSPYYLMIISILLGVSGQFLFKCGLNREGGGIDLSWRIVHIMFTPYVAAGLACYVLSTFTWLSALSKVPLSFLYPMLSLGYLIIFLISVFFLHEQYTHTKLLANLLIIAGIILLFWGKK